MNIKKSVWFSGIVFLFFSCNLAYLPVEITGNSIPLSENPELTDAATEKIILPYRDSLSKVMNEVIGTSKAVLISEAPQGTLGNFVADLLYFDIPLYEEYTYLNTLPYFVLLNTRGLRMPLPEGEVSRGDIFGIMPFENKIVIAQMPPETFPEIGQFLAESGGHPLSRNMKLLSSGGKLESFSLNERQPSSDYYIITTDYLSGGGDNMTFFSKAVRIRDTGILLRDQIEIHIRNLTEHDKMIEAKKDDRILLR